VPGHNPGSATLVLEHARRPLVKVVTWNVNSIKQRLPRLLAVLERHRPDIVCLQELKVEDDVFPIEAIVGAGYGAVAFGQRSYNGVAILARAPIEGVMRGFEGDPLPEQARVLSARVRDVRVVCVYVVNGQAVGTPAYTSKLEWMDALHAWIASTSDAGEPLLVCGDFNVAPDDRDVWDPELWRGQVLASDPERARLRALIDWGLVDLGRRAAGDVQGPFTFWDYTAGAFHKKWGLRLDLVLATDPLAARLVSAEVDRNERKPTAGEGKPSDHAPLVVTFGD
jgi:exodeoxyribonuclease-3